MIHPLLHTLTNLFAHMCTHMHTHPHSQTLSIPLCTFSYVYTFAHAHILLHASTCTYLVFMNICIQAINRFSGTHLCALTNTQICTACVCTWVSILCRYIQCVPGFTFPGWGSEACPGISRSLAFGKSTTWWTLGVYANTPPSPRAPASRGLWAAPRLAGNK